MIPVGSDQYGVPMMSARDRHPKAALGLLPRLSGKGAPKHQIGCLNLHSIQLLRRRKSWRIDQIESGQSGIRDAGLETPQVRGAMLPGVADREIDRPVAGDAGQAGCFGVTQHQRPARVWDHAVGYYGLVKQQIGQ